MHFIKGIRNRALYIGAEIKRLLSCLVRKKSEVQELDLKDVVLAKATLDIHRKRTHSEC